MLDIGCDECYFQFYGYMSQQQNMMQDYIRTSTYQRAMLDNMADFQDKVYIVELLSHFSSCISSLRLSTLFYNMHPKRIISFKLPQARYSRYLSV